MDSTRVNSSNLDSAYLAAKAMTEQWYASFLTQWFEPQFGTLYGAAARSLSQMPPEAQEASRRLRPEGWKEVDRLVKRQKGSS